MNQHNLGTFKENFIKQYIVARNQIIPSYFAMQRRWRADSEGLVYAMSSIEIYAEFTRTDMWHAVMIGRVEPLTFRCDVSFGRIVLRARRIEENFETYAVNFRYICEDESAGQSIAKDFTIAISIAFQDSVNWNERLDNPLGLKVVGYEIESAHGDPLNREWLRTMQ